MTPTVSVVIPSLRGGDRLRALVRSLRDEGTISPQIVVADNGVSKGDVAALRAMDATVLAMRQNLGFGRAVNRAAQAAEGDVLVILNDDIVVSPGLLEKLAGPVSTGAAMVCGVLLREDDPAVIESAGIETDRTLSPYDYLQGHSISVLDQDPPPPLGPSGGIAAFNRELFLQDGGFDEGFFAYCEDVDLALRLRGAGGSVAMASGARAYHTASRTLGYHSLPKACMVGESRGYLIRKYGLLRHPSTAATVLGVETAASLALAKRHRSLAPAWARVRGFARARREGPPPPGDAATVGLLDGWRRRYGRSRLNRDSTS